MIYLMFLQRKVTKQSKELTVKEKEQVEKKCLNCEYSLNSMDQYCPSCGQATYREEDVGSFVTHFLNDYFTFDSKIFRSIQPLFSKPGLLTLEYLKGKRVKYIPPLRLFIFTSIIFFLLLGLLDSSAEVVVIDSEDRFWDRFFESWLPKLFFILSPLFAILLAMLFKKREGSLLVHFLFSLHFHATLFFLGIIYVFISWILAAFEWQILNQIILSLSGLFLLIYLWKALMVVYSESILGTSWRYLLLAISYMTLIGFSMMVLVLLSS